MKATAILETVIYAADPLACAAFYISVLGLEPVRELPGRFSFLRCGAQMLLIFAPGPALDPDQQNGIPTHGATGRGHLCFGAADGAELDRWSALLAQRGVVVEHRHQWPNGRSLYFRDPAGNSVEIAETAIWDK